MVNNYIKATPKIPELIAYAEKLAASALNPELAKINLSAFKTALQNYSLYPAIGALV